MNKLIVIILIFVVLVVGIGAGYFFGYTQGFEKFTKFFVKNSDIPSNSKEVTNFEECIASGNPVMESYPRKCNASGQTFTEYIGNELEKSELIRLTNPRPNQAISSPLIITGEARGYWFFEANFPVILTDWDGRIVAQHYAEAQLDPSNPDSTWMTTEFVPFKSVLEFELTEESKVYNRGSLILNKSNASGLPEHDDAMEIPILFATELMQ